MASYELRTFSDIYTAVIDELKVQSSDTTTLNRIKRDINMYYLNEVAAHKSWPWLRRTVDLIHYQYHDTGTASVTNGDNSVTISTSISEDKTGKYFKLDSYDEIYKIRSHSGTAITLESDFTGTTNATANYKIFDKGVPLPADMSETCKVWNDFNHEDMQPLNDKDFLELSLHTSELSGRPDYFRVTEIQDPTPFATISGLPAISTVASSGLVKTIVFASDVSSYLEEGDVIEVTAADDETYNGEFVIDSVSTTTAIFTGYKELTESANADTNMTVKLRDNSRGYENNRVVEVFPYLYTEDTTIHIEGIREVPPLEHDEDEPLIPINDRIILVYGALYRGWTRLRNPEAAISNLQLFNKKLRSMSGKIQSSTDVAQIKMNKLYLRGRRRGSRRYGWRNF